jgi:hypothetical protein
VLPDLGGDAGIVLRRRFDRGTVGSGGVLVSITIVHPSASLTPMKTRSIRPIVLALAAAAAAVRRRLSTTAPDDRLQLGAALFEGKTAESRRLDVLSFTVASAGNVSVTSPA